MSRPPSDTRIDRAALLDVNRVSLVLSRFMGEVASGLRSLTFLENFRAQWHQFNVTIPGEEVVARSYVRAIYRASGGSIPTGSETIVNFNTMELDSHSAVTTGSSWKFTAPFTGPYLLTSAVTFDPCANNTQMQLNLFKNTVKHRRMFRVEHGDSLNGALTMTGNVILNLTQNDFVDLRVFQNSAGDMAIDPDDETWISIQELPTVLSDTSITDPIPASCWPYDFLYNFDRRPLMVLPGEIRELASNANVGAGWLDWDMAFVNGRTAIRIRNIEGLTPGKTYRVTVLVVVE